MASYDNSRYTYGQVLAGGGYYMKDDNLRYSAGVLQMQSKLNKAGFWCGTVDGKFGAGTDEAVRHFQRAFNLTVDGKAGKGTLSKLDVVSSSSPGFIKTSGTYGIYFDSENKCFMHNQQIVYLQLRSAKLEKKVVAAIMGNIEAESKFRTTWTSGTSSAGICQWLPDRKTNLEKYAASISDEKTSIHVQAKFILEECKAGIYGDAGAIECLKALKETTVASDIIKATDYFTALYERCENFSSLSEAQAAGRDTSRFAKNVYDERYYLDTPKRRGYAQAYYACMSDMT